MLDFGKLGEDLTGEWVKTTVEMVFNESVGFQAVDFMLETLQGEEVIQGEGFQNFKLYKNSDGTGEKYALAEIALGDTIISDMNKPLERKKEIIGRVKDLSKATEPGLYEAPLALIISLREGQ